jgi:ribosomal-protein-alanine N-acetyltransferase
MTDPSLNPRITMLVAAHVDDAAALAAIHAESFAEPWTADEFDVFLRQIGVTGWMAREAGRPRGFILIRRAVEEAEVLTLAVLPSARRRGIGRLLVSHAIEQLRDSGTASLYLEVAVNNRAAVGLYHSLGFAQCGKRRAYYAPLDGGPPGDALVMRCDL